ncbi:MAG: 4Fe-4S dicluster domain-containing protein [Chloroflexi bacterium]|nr:4Fe-4S dicluster domain-containing protein [Chloroflexota bacterium]
MTTAGAPDLAPDAQALLLGEHTNMLACIRCGQCLTSCPTYILTGNEAEGPRGRIALARALTEGHLPLTPDLIAHEHNCLVCDACTAVCPAGVHMDPLQVALRAAIAPRAGRRWWQRAALQAGFATFGAMWRFRLLIWLLWLYQRSGVQWLARQSGLLRLLRLADTEAMLPPLPAPWTALVPRGETYPAAPGATAAPRRAALFAGCVMSTALAAIDRATVRVCQRAGWEVVAPAGQGCCGALHAHGGDRDGLLRLARQTIAAFEASGDAPVVVNSAGCGAMLKDYAHHLRDDPAWTDRARAFSARVRDLTELIAPADLTFTRPVAAAVTYQEPCHLVHAQRISRQPRALLRAIPGLELREMAESSLCCGSAGIYNITNPDQAGRLLTRKLGHAERTGAAVIATANPGCYLQIQAGLTKRGSAVRVRHIVELLDEATAP